LKRFQPQVRKLSPRNDVWCIKKEAKGRTLSVGAPTAKLDCVWIPTSKFFTPWITSKFLLLKIESIYIKINYSIIVITINVLIIITEIFIKFGSVVSSVN
jgi:hypothetical protein